MNLKYLSNIFSLMYLGNIQIKKKNHLSSTNNLYYLILLICKQQIKS